MLAVDGDTAELVESDGARAVLISARAYPPGAPLIGELAESAAPLEFRVRGSRRLEDGRFRVEGRHVNLSRAQRALLTG